MITLGLAASKLVVVLNESYPQGVFKVSPADVPSDEVPIRDAADLLTTLNPFSSRLNDETEHKPIIRETELNLRLAGIRNTPEEPATGSAMIVVPDDKQILVRIGDKILPDTYLTSIDASHVTLSRMGTLEILSFGAQRKEALSNSNGDANQAKGPGSAPAPEESRLLGVEQSSISIWSPEMQDEGVARQLQSSRTADVLPRDVSPSQMQARPVNAQALTQVHRSERGH